MPGNRPIMLSSPMRHPIPGMTKRSSIQWASRASRRRDRSNSSGSRTGRSSATASSFLGNDPDRVDDAGNIAEQRQQDVQPEVPPEADLQEDPERGQKNGDDDANDVHDRDRKDVG